MLLEFEKWHGCCNDFVIVYLGVGQAEMAINALRKEAPRICSRRGDGVGADGILAVVRRDASTAKVTIINSDGSVAENCGNGLRCVVGSFARNSSDRSGEDVFVELHVQGHIYTGAIVQRVNDSRWIGAVTLGVPEVAQVTESADIVQTCAAVGLNAAAIYEVELGNRHLVVQVDQIQPEIFTSLSPQLSAGGELNVHFVSEAAFDLDWRYRGAIGEQFKMFPWERGVGSTQACGSGAAATAAAVFEQSVLDDDEAVAVRMPGGDIVVTLQDRALRIEGPVQHVFQGSFML